MIYLTLNQYQDYTDQRLAIERKFNEDIATLQEQRKQAEKDGNTEQVEIDRSITQATKDKGMELMNMDYNKLKESPEYVRAFENSAKTSLLKLLISSFSTRECKRDSS